MIYILLSIQHRTLRKAHLASKIWLTNFACLLFFLLSFSISIYIFVLFTFYTLYYPFRGSLFQDPRLNWYKSVGLNNYSKDPRSPSSNMARSTRIRVKKCCVETEKRFDVPPCAAHPHSLSRKSAPDSHMPFLWSVLVGRFCRMFSGSWAPVPHGHSFM